jgi:hypothetical protein
MDVGKELPEVAESSRPLGCLKTGLTAGRLPVVGGEFERSIVPVQPGQRRFGKRESES